LASALAFGSDLDLGFEGSSVGLLVVSSLVNNSAIILYLETDHPSRNVSMLLFAIVYQESNVWSVTWFPMEVRYRLESPCHFIDGQAQVCSL